MISDLAMRVEGVLAIILESRDLSAANLTACTLWNVNLSKGVLREANLSNAAIRGCDFAKARLSTIDLEDVELAHAKPLETEISSR